MSTAPRKAFEVRYLSIDFSDTIITWRTEGLHSAAVVITRIAGLYWSLQDRLRHAVATRGEAPIHSHRRCYARATRPSQLLPSKFSSWMVSTTCASRIQVSCAFYAGWIEARAVLLSRLAKLGDGRQRLMFMKKLDGSWLRLYCAGMTAGECFSPT
jgi:hypothetical protein